jgi:hypothetical protein
VVFLCGLSLADIVALLTEMRPVIMVDYGGKLPELQDHLCALVKFCQQVLCMSRVVLKIITF